ncbi:Sec1 family protein [Trichomonas vaginalis G3]|uniref:Sec1 family protein n=1 Tax=Trichomonas vaginalis (strain ATCC PRA-98 / G3) TaxID=412133 RepID=A2ESF3_TRIV3|nr:vesicle docking involved in exocytosis [Trichomonas vaginalis G3]EAY04397.1 Sec1 family protein [Trichomonas vaginalis G3]KAI5526346.1 vesicle docking involved in exocytosis [Trichomonas vaginalis G3]|eukprot:XP_001316620.1 Sec1 family protein [Trichomonas vaginalis G3]
MNVQTSAYLYLSKILETQPGVKALLLDQETFNFISVAMTKTELLEKEVVLFENLTSRVHKPEDPSCTSLNCIIFVRPTSDNVELISRELDHPHFQRYSIFFSNTSAEAHIRQLAAHDSQSLVDIVREVYLDFYPLNAKLFSLNVPDISILRAGNSFNEIAGRIPEGLFAFLCSQRVKPHIRFDSSSSACQSVARSVTSLIDDSRDLFATAQESATVLILDRRSDPIAPLLHLWYYSAALHDLFGIDKNVVTVDGQQYVLNERTDPESAPYYTMYLGDLAPKLETRVKRIQDTLREIQRQSDDLNDMHGKMSAVSKGQTEKVYAGNHLDLFNAVHSKISQGNLMEVSGLEQIVAVYDYPDDQCQQIIEMINNPSTQPLDALRLVLIFALHHEKKSNITTYMTKLLESLEAKTVWHNNEMKYVDMITQIMGDRQRGHEDLFQNRTGLTKFTQGIKSFVTVEKSQYEMYKCLLYRILQKLKEGRLSDQHYPFATKSQPTKTSKVIVFYIGGATYEEMRVATELSQPGFDIMVGGTTVHSAESFLKYELAPYC